MEKQKKHVMSPVQLLLRPSPWVETYFGGVLEVFATLAQECPKTHGKPKKDYFTSIDPRHDIYTFCYWHIFWHSI